MKNIIKQLIIGGVGAAMLLSTASVFAAMPPPKTIRQQAEQRKAAAKQKIATLKDQKKRDMANKIADQFSRVNTVWTNHFTKVLDHLNAVLEKIKSRADKAAANGSDVTAVNEAIQTASTAIASAKAAVAAQATKTYTVDATAVTAPTTASDQNSLVAQLREQFKIVHGQLKADLTALRDGPVKDARTAVHDALQALKQVPQVDED